MAREKILVVGHDLDNLSRIYLALIHRKFKTEACDKPEEIPERIKRFKPGVIVLDLEAYNPIREKLKIPAIVLTDEDVPLSSKLNDGDIWLAKPVQVDTLIKAVETFF
jgi:DNA-binding response OmpR family regulator